MVVEQYELFDDSKMQGSITNILRLSLI